MPTSKKRYCITLNHVSNAIDGLHKVIPSTRAGHISASRRPDAQHGEKTRDEFLVGLEQHQDARRSMQEIKSRSSDVAPGAEENRV